MKAHMDVREGESDRDVRPSRHSEQPIGSRPPEAEMRYRGATYPPATPRGDSTTCHNWMRRARNAAIEAAR